MFCPVQRTTVECEDDAAALRRGKCKAVSNGNSVAMSGFGRRLISIAPRAFEFHARASVMIVMPLHHDDGAERQTRNPQGDQPQEAAVAVVYTAGDLTLTQVGPDLFTITDDTRALADFDGLARALAHGHETATRRRVTLWRGVEGRPERRLIASYRTE